MTEVVLTNNKTGLIITFIFILISIICLIINYSIDQLISWSLFPIGGLIVIWATLIPFLIMKENKAIGVFTGLTLTLIPYIFLIQNLVSTKGWFMPLALPIVIMSLIALGVSLFALTNTKINKFLASALTIFLFGITVNIGVGVVVSRYLDEINIYDIYRVSTIVASAILSLALLIIGYDKRKQA